MLHFAIVCLVLAVVAAILGFGGMAAAFTSIAKIAFFIFAALFVISLISSMMNRSAA